MITVSFQFQDDVEAQAMLDDFCYRLKYPEEVNNPDFNPQELEHPVDNPATIPNPETKLQFWKKAVLSWSASVAADGIEMRNKEQNRATYMNLNVT